MTTAFFEEVFGIPTPGFIEIRVKPAVPDPRWPQRWPSSFHASVADAAQAALAADAAGDEAYFGLGRRTRKEAKGRSIIALAVVWLDKDFHDCPPEEVDGKIAAFLVHLRASAPPPSLVIQSGRGLHCYWLLHEPAQPEQVRAVNKALAIRFGEKPGEATDPARVLRVPGTHNRKKKYGAPILVEPVGEFWVPGQASVRYRIDELPSLPVIQRADNQLTAQPEVMARVLAVAPGATRGSGGKVDILCPFHADTVSSGVVFAPTAYFFCSACDVSESVLKWTRRSVVRSWRVAELVRRPKAKRALSVPTGYFRASRIAIKNIGPALVAGDVRPVLHLADSRVVLGRKILTDVREAAEAIRAALGPLGFRVFWAAVALGQAGDRRFQADGRVPISVRAIGDLLGFHQVGDGRLHSSTRRAIGKALDGLASLYMTFRWAPRAPWFRGAVLAPVGQWEGGVRVYQLHLGVWYALRGRSQAWVPAHRAALRLDDARLATYLRAIWEATDHGREVRAFDLAMIATKAGVWPMARYAHDPGRVVREWASAYAAVPDLGVRVEVGDFPRLVLGGPLLLHSGEQEREATTAASPVPTPSLIPVATAESSTIVEPWKDGFRVECPTAPRVMSHPRSARGRR